MFHAGPDINRMYHNAYRSDLTFTPGDQTHFEVFLRQGFTDFGVANKGVKKKYFGSQEHGHFVVLTGAQEGVPVT